MSRIIFYPHAALKMYSISHLPRCRLTVLNINSFSACIFSLPAWMQVMSDRMDTVALPENKIFIRAKAFNSFKGYVIND